MSQEAHDALEIRCPRLGGPVAFAYCRRANDDLPCRSLLGCWSRRFDVVAFLRAHFTPDQLKRAFAPPSKTRLESLVEIAERARRPGGPNADSSPRHT